MNTNGKPLVVATSKEDLRFRAGKLIMLSPKHNTKEVLQKLRTSAGVQLYAKQPGKSLFIPGMGLMEPQDFDLRFVGALSFGRPLFLIADPYLVDNKAVMAAAQALRSDPQHGGSGKPGQEAWRYNYHSPSNTHWVLNCLVDEKPHVAYVPPRTWKHYLCVVVPRRLEKYAIK